MTDAERLEYAIEAARAYLRAGSDRQIAIAYAATDYGVSKEAIAEAL